MGLAIYAFRQKKTAEANAIEASQQKDTAVKNEARAEEQEGIAKTNEAKARENQLLAEARERIARSRALAIQSREARAFPDTSLLLGLATIQAEPTLDAESALMGTQLAYPRLESSLYAWHGAANRLVQAIASSPDGQTLVAGYQDGAVISWHGNQARGTYLRRPRSGWLSSIDALAFSADGRYLAAAISDGSIDSWDWTDRKRLRTIWLAHPDARYSGQVPNSRAEALAFNPKTGLLAAGQFDGRIRLWDVTTGLPVGPEFGDPIPPDQNDHTIGVQSLAFSSDGGLLASGYGGNVESGQTAGVIRVWNANDGYRAGKVIRTETNGVPALAVHPRKNWVAYGGSSTAVQLADMIGSEGQVPQIPPTAAGVGRAGATSLAFSSDGDILVAGFADGRVALWRDLRTDNGTPVPPEVFASGHAPSVAAITFVHHRNLFATGGPDGVVRLWHSRLEPVGQPFGDLSHLGCVFSDDGTILACTGLADTLEWWDVASHSKVAEHPVGNHESVAALAFVSASELELLTRSGRLLRCTRESCVAVPRRSASDQSESVSLGPQANFWFEWRDRPYRCSAVGCDPLPGPARYDNKPNAVSPDGLRWAVRGWTAGDSPGGVISFCQASGCRPLDVGAKGSSTWIGGMEFSPSGSILVVGTGDGRVMFFDGRSGTRLGPAIAAHSGGVECFDFRRDGTIMASGGRDGMVLLWDVATRQPIGTPFPRPSLDQVSALLFHPGGRELLVQYSGGSANRVMLLNVDAGYWQAHACRAAGRDLTLAEWNLHGAELPLKPVCPGAPHPADDWEPRPPAPF